MLRIIHNYKQDLIYKKVTDINFSREGGELACNRWLQLEPYFVNMLSYM